MVSRGARATPDEQQEIVRYLTANYGVAAAAPTNTASGEEAAEEGPAPVVAPAPPAPTLNDAQIAHAQQLVSSNGCLSCHRLQGEGSFAGPDLSDAGMKESATQIRASLTSPPKELAPENRSVRLTTQDGKTMVGKLLNQDAFTVQLIDAAGHLMSLDKANLREFTIMTANGMPSYVDKIAPQDLSLLISYLATLRTAAQP
jgi:putative heme-binding domain-containing protein